MVCFAYSRSRIVVFIALLYYGNVLDIYWQSNFVFNVKMQAYYGDRKIDVIDYPVFFLSGGLVLLSIATQWQKQGIIYRTIALLFVLELFQRCFYFAIAPYYMLPFMAFAACLNSVLIERAMHKHFWTVWVLLIVAAAYAAISEPRYLSARTTDRSFARYVSANVTPCDYVISSFLSNQSIISKDPHYYWSLLGHVDIAGEETGIALKPDLNKLVMQYKPKLVSSGVYWNNYYLNRGRNVPVQQISPEIIGRYYLPTPFQGLYLLKYEYQGKNCIYDKTGESGVMQDKILTKFLWLYIICATIAACFVYGIIAKANGDNVEHLHSSWLIWQGYVPYRDFFSITIR